MKQLASTWTQKGDYVLEIRGRAGRCSQSRRIERAAVGLADGTAYGEQAGAVRRERLELVGGGHERQFRQPRDLLLELVRNRCLVYLQESPEPIMACGVKNRRARLSLFWRLPQQLLAWCDFSRRYKS